MNGKEVLRLVDAIHRDKGIDKEYIFQTLEAAILAASRKRLRPGGEVAASIDRESGEVQVSEEGRPVELADFGRIAAQAAKQAIVQKIREAEQGVLLEEYLPRVESMVTGIVQRMEKGHVIVNLGRTEAILPRNEQVASESYQPGERLRAYLVKVVRKGSRVALVLSRTNPHIVEELFRLEIPEISDRLVEIKGVVREPGQRTKIAVWSHDTRVDPVGACVGVRGNRIRGIVDELRGEKIDIVRWASEPENFIKNSLSPAEISRVDLDRENGWARVVVPEDQLALAIGKRGQNIRLAAKLTGWKLEVVTEEAYKQEREENRAEMHKIPGLPPEIIERMMMAGFASLKVIAAKGAQGLLAVKGLSEGDTQAVYDYALRRLKEMEAERAAAAAAESAEKAAAEKPAEPVKDTGESEKEMEELPAEELPVSAERPEEKIERPGSPEA